MKKILIAFFAALGTALLTLSDLSCSSHLNWLLEYRWFEAFYEDILKSFFEKWSLWAGLICNTFAILIEFLFPSSPKPILRSYLNQLHYSLFDGEFDKVRITVFRIRYGILLWLPFFLKNIVCIKQHWKKNTLVYQFLSFPWFPWKKYVVIYVRRGKPHEKGTMTIFKYPESGDDVDGVVSYAIMKEQKYSTSLPDVRPISLEKCNKIDDIDDYSKREKIKEYIEKSHLKSFRQFKSIHSKSTQLWAMPIVGDDENSAWGALVVDCLKNDSPFKNKHIDQSLELAATTIYTILRAK